MLEILDDVVMTEDNFPFYHKGEYGTILGSGKIGDDYFSIRLDSGKVADAHIEHITYKGDELQNMYNETLALMEQVIENLDELSNNSDDYHVESKLACLGGRAMSLLNELKELEN